MTKKQEKNERPKEAGVFKKLNYKITPKDTPWRGHHLYYGAGIMFFFFLAYFESDNRLVMVLDSIGFLWMTDDWLYHRFKNSKIKWLVKLVHNLPGNLAHNWLCKHSGAYRWVYEKLGGKCNG